MATTTDEQSSRKGASPSTTTLRSTDTDKKQPEDNSSRPLKEILSTATRLERLVCAIAVLIYIAIPVFLFLYRPPLKSTNLGYPEYLAQDWTGARLVWTVIIALLPLFIVLIGFYAWRRICPLAFFSRISEYVGFPDPKGVAVAKMKRKRLPKWFAKNYPIITWTFLTLMLVLRILLINSNAAALAWTFVGLALLAMLTGFLFTGKTWCNFICPVGTIERIYTDTTRTASKKNSQCSRCTGCKTVPASGLCPDINQENDYWQEAKSPARMWAFYSWPGVVLGFYLWYYLHKPYYWHDFNAKGIYEMRGTSIEVPTYGQFPTDWGYYLSGDWTRDPAPWLSWYQPAFGFSDLPAYLAKLPVIAGAPLLLLFFAIISYFLFRVSQSIWCEVLTRRGKSETEANEIARHSMFSVAAYAGFLCFYQFAGAPTLRFLPFNLYPYFQAIILGFATLVLATRLRRSRQAQLQSDQARKWLRNWPLKDVTPPKDLNEAYRLVTERLRTTEDRIRLYLSTVRNMLSDHLITPNEISILEGMAKDMDISEADKRTLVKQLNNEYPGIFTGDLHDGLRLLGYRAEIERFTNENKGLLPDVKTLRMLQERYQIQEEEHQAIIQEMRDPIGTRAELIIRGVEELQILRRDIEVLKEQSRPALRFLYYELKQTARESRQYILHLANLYGPLGELSKLGVNLPEDNLSGSNVAEAIEAWLKQHVPERLAEPITEVICRPVPPIDIQKSGDVLSRTLIRWGQVGELYMQAAATYASGIARIANANTKSSARSRAESLLQSETPILREAAVAGLAPQLTTEQWKSALTDPVLSVRRGAIMRVPSPLSAEMVTLVRTCLEDSDERVRLKAAALLENHDALTADGKPLPILTTLEMMFCLRNIRLLSHLPAASLHRLAESAEERFYKHGDYLCKQGDPGDEVYLLVEGRTEAYLTQNNEEKLLGMSRPGECVGEMAILDPAPRMASVRALDSLVHVLVVHGDDFRKLLNQDTGTAMGVIRILIHRQRETAKRT